MTLYPLLKHNSKHMVRSMYLILKFERKSKLYYTIPRKAKYKTNKSTYNCRKWEVFMYQSCYPKWKYYYSLPPSIFQVNSVPLLNLNNIVAARIYKHVHVIPIIIKLKL